MKKSLILSVALLLLSALTTFAQELHVRGYVYGSDDGEPVIGAAVMIKNTYIGTVTNIHGYYELDCPSNATLVYSALSYLPQEIMVQARPYIEVVLEFDDEWPIFYNNNYMWALALPIKDQSEKKNTNHYFTQRT